ncbi:Uncharacterised protein [uncultured Clostridium sp.]|nr:Uncharacterised protein [uncultured Clostridium sp.]
MIIIKGKNIIIVIVVIIAILIAGIYYILTPDKKVSINTQSNSITIEELLKCDFLDSFEILKNPIRLEGRLLLSESEFRDIVYTVMNNYNIEEFKYSNISLQEKYIKVISPYKFLNLIDTQYEVNIYPTIVDNNLYLTLKNFRIGKLKISDSIVQSVLKSKANALPFEINKNVIIVDKSYMQPINIKTIDIKDDEVIVYVLVTTTDIIQFIGDYNTK